MGCTASKPYRVEFKTRATCRPKQNPLWEPSPRKHSEETLRRFGALPQVPGLSREARLPETQTFSRLRKHIQDLDAAIAELGRLNPKGVRKAYLVPETVNAELFMMK